MAQSKRKPSEPRLTLSDPLSAITPNHCDEPIIGAVHELHTALASQPEVTAHVLELADLRDAAHESPDGWGPYWRARDKSPLSDYFGEWEIDTMAATVRELIEAKCWGLLVPMNSRGAGYGRQKDRARTPATPQTIKVAVADVVDRLTPTPEPSPAELQAALDWSCTQCDAYPGEDCKGGTIHAARLKPPDAPSDAVRRERQRVWKARQRVRELVRA